MNSRFRPDARTRADKLRDLAAHPNTNAHERQRALDELRRMGEHLPEPTSSARRARLRMLLVREPWASEIASGKKTVELRKYAIAPGPLGIASTAEGKSSGRLLCVVDVVECLQPGHPWLRQQGVPAGLWGIVLDSPRSAAVKPAVSGQQGIWYLEVEGPWADLAEGRAPSSETTTSRYGGRAERAGYEEVERQRKERQAREAEAAKARAEEARRAREQAADKARDEAARRAEAASRAKESPEEVQARTREQMRAEHEAEARRVAETRARQDAVLAAEEARRRESEAKAERERRERVEDVARRRAGARWARAKAEEDRAAALERSPFRHRGEGDLCPACGVAPLEVSEPSAEVLGRKYRCAGCGEGFRVIRSSGVLMYYRG